MQVLDAEGADLETRVEVLARLGVALAHLVYRLLAQQVRV